MNVEKTVNELAPLLEPDYPEPGDVQGRCDCAGRFTVYLWKGAQGRRLKNAYCPHCETKLARTSCPIGTNPTFVRKEPVFK